MSFDINSLILYYFMACFCCILLKQAFVNNTIVSQNRVNSNVYYVLIFAFLTLFGGLRKVAWQIGGADALNYETHFLNALSGVNRETLEPLFHSFVVFIRKITGSPVIYRVICYGFISFSYIFFIKNTAWKKASVVPFIMIILFYLKGFNTMRSTMAACLLLLGLVALYKKRNILALCTAVACLFVHRMSIAFLPLIPLYWAFSKSVESWKPIKYAIIIVACSMLAYFFATKLQAYVVALDILEGSDSYYISHNEGFLNSVILLFPDVALLLFFVFVNPGIFHTKKANFCKCIVAYDILITPAAILLGFWRYNEFLFLSRLSLWGVLISIFRSRFQRQSQPIITSVAFLLFSAWLIYRILREWEPNNIMPYLLFWG